MKVENRKHCFHAAVGNRRDVLVIFFFAFYLAIFFKREFVKAFFSEKFLKMANFCQKITKTWRSSHKRT
jgi:hypothetical protein